MHVNDTKKSDVPDYKRVRAAAAFEIEASPLDSAVPHRKGSLIGLSRSSCPVNQSITQQNRGPGST